MGQIQKAIVCAVVKNEFGEILIDRRNQPDFPQIHGKWELLGGHIGFAEEPEVAIIREVKEETGLKNLKLVSELPLTYHIYYNGDRRFIKTTRWFRMEGTTADLLVPQIEEGIIIARWIPANSLACIFMHTYESLKPLIKSVLANT